MGEGSSNGGFLASALQPAPATSVIDLAITGDVVSFVTNDLESVLSCFDVGEGIATSGIDVQSPLARPGGEFLGCSFCFYGDFARAQRSFERLRRLGKPVGVAGGELG